MIYPSIDKLLNEVGSKYLLVNLISKEFNCGHSSVVYWCNKAKELYFNDSNFRNDYDMFSTELDFYIKKL